MEGRKGWIMGLGCGLVVLVVLMSCLVVVEGQGQGQQGQAQGQGLSKATGDGAKAGTTSGAAPGSAAKAAKAPAAAPVENVNVNVGAEKKESKGSAEEKTVEVHAGGSCGEDLCTAPPAVEAAAVVDKVGIAVDSEKDEKIKALEIQLANLRKEKTRELEAVSKQLQVVQDENSKLKSASASASANADSNKETIAKLEADLKKSSEDIGKLQQTLAATKRQQETEKIAAEQVISKLNEQVRSIESASAASSAKATGENDAELTKCQADLAKSRKDFDENQLIIISKRVATAQSNLKVYALELRNLTQVYAGKALVLADQGLKNVKAYWPVFKDEVNKLYLEGKPRFIALLEEAKAFLLDAKPRLNQLKEEGIEKTKEKLSQLENYFEAQNAFLPVGVNKPPQLTRYMTYGVAGVVALIALVIIFKIIKLIFWILLAPVRMLRGKPSNKKGGNKK